MTIEEFQQMNSSKEEKEKVLSAMTNEQIDELISQSSNVQAKIFYSKFKK